MRDSGDDSLFVCCSFLFSVSEQLMLLLCHIKSIKLVKHREVCVVKQTQDMQWDFNCSLVR